MDRSYWRARFSLGLVHSLYSFVYFDLFAHAPERLRMPTSPSQPIAGASANAGLSLGLSPTPEGKAADCVNTTTLGQPADPQVVQPAHELRKSSLELIAIQTARREKAEQASDAAWQEVAQLQAQVEHLQRRTRLITEELAAAEAELQSISAIHAAPRRENGMAQPLLLDCTVMYVGGRPSSTPAIRDFVQRHGGEFLHHSAGVAHCLAMLATLRPGTCIVALPVDCAGHESTTDIRRTCERQGLPFMALRTASVACFAASVRRESLPRATKQAATPCLRHG